MKRVKILGVYWKLKGIKVIVLWEEILLSDKEKKLLEILVDKTTVKEAEKELVKAGITLASAYKMLYSLRNRGSMAMRLVNQILGFRRRSNKLEGSLENRLQFKS